MRKILFASSEVHPLMKTGGLADVSASLPLALAEQGQDVRLIMPAYRQCLAKISDYQTVASIKVDGYHLPVEILQTTLPGSTLILWLVHSPHHFDRDGGPYGDEQGDWPDNAARYALFSRVVAAVASSQADMGWQADIVHCNDWQTGLTPALLSTVASRPKTIFTIHNLAYQGLFSRDVFEALDLDEALWDSEGIEFYGLMSFMKGGLIYADHITTVSPSYAQEICSYEYGYGLEGLLTLRAEQQRLTGILNGIDPTEWDPQHDKAIAKTYTLKTVKNKEINKQALLDSFSLPVQEGAMLIGMISRLVPQKGIDLAVKAISELLSSGSNIQLICLGNGEHGFEQDLRVLRARYPDKVAIHIGYSEAMAHQIEAGSDVFLMPSRFEPCGLNQLYSLRYGTLPIVRNTGGLADSVTHASEEARQDGTATGFKFEMATPQALIACIEQAVEVFQRPRIWRKMVLTAMAKDYSWQKSATRYIELYETL